MRKPFLILLNFFFFTTCFSQDYHRIDSLKNILITTKEDTLKGVAIWSLVDEYMYTKPDTGWYYAKMGLSLIDDNTSIKNEFGASQNPLLYSFETRMYAKGA